jgi:hypothetical protein
MSIDVIKNYSTANGWDEAVKHIPEVAEYSTRNVLGKKQSLDLLIKSYEAGRRDAQTGKLAAS